jgi:hypothetical protein
VVSGGCWQNRWRVVRGGYVGGWWMVDGGWSKCDAALQRAERERPRDQEAEAD